MPNGTPMRIASPKPLRTRLSVAAVLSISDRSEKSVGMLRSTSTGLGTSTGEITRDSGVLPSVSSHQSNTTIPTPATPSPRRTIGGGSARRANSRRKDDVATETPTSTRVGRP